MTSAMLSFMMLMKIHSHLGHGNHKSLYKGPVDFFLVLIRKAFATEDLFQIEITFITGIQWKCRCEASLTLTERFSQINKTDNVQNSSEC